MASEAQVRTRRNAIERNSGAQLRKFAEMFAIRSGLVRQRNPVEICRVHEHRTEIALARINQWPPVYAFPDRLVSVLIHFCAIGLERGVNTLRKCAVLREFGCCLFKLFGGEIAAAARSSELKNQSFARQRARLRPVVSAFGKICDAAGPHDAVCREIEVALKLKTHLIEIVAMPRRIVGGRGGKLQREIAGR